MKRRVNLAKFHTALFAKDANGGGVHLGDTLPASRKNFDLKMFYEDGSQVMEVVFEGRKLGVPLANVSIMEFGEVIPSEKKG